mgnify:CR=1 FL=1
MSPTSTRASTASGDGAGRAPLRPGLAKEQLPPLNVPQRRQTARTRRRSRRSCRRRPALHRARSRPSTRRGQRSASTADAIAQPAAPKAQADDAGRLPAPRHVARRAAPAVPRADGRRDRPWCGLLVVFAILATLSADAPAGGAHAAADARGARRGLGPPRRLRAGAFVGRAGPADAHVQPHDAEARANRSPKSRTTSARWRTRSRSGRASSKSRPPRPTSSRSTTS